MAESSSVKGSNDLSENEMTTEQFRGCFDVMNSIKSQELNGIHSRHLRQRRQRAKLLTAVNNHSLKITLGFEHRGQHNIVPNFRRMTGKI